MRRESQQKPDLRADTMNSTLPMIAVSLSPIGWPEQAYSRPFRCLQGIGEQQVARLACFPAFGNTNPLNRPFQHDGMVSHDARSPRLYSQGLQGRGMLCLTGLAVRTTRSQGRQGDTSPDDHCHVL